MENIVENFQFLTETLGKTSQNTSAYSFASAFLLFWEKNLHFLAAEGGGATVPPPSKQVFYVPL